MNPNCPEFLDPQVWTKAMYFSRIRRVIEYIEERLEEPLSLDCVAKIGCMEKTAFSKHFKIKTGVSLSKFLQVYRVSKAAAGIRASDESLTSVGLSAGFSNISSFERTFKSVTGQTPSTYRKCFLRGSCMSGKSGRTELETATSLSSQGK